MFNESGGTEVLEYMIDGNRRASANPVAGEKVVIMVKDGKIISASIFVGQSICE